MRCSKEGFQAFRKDYEKYECKWATILEDLQRDHLEFEDCTVADLMNKCEELGLTANTYIVNHSLL